MHELPTILPERIDDIPLLLEPRQRRGLPTLFDTHFPTHGTGTGLSLGWVSPLWLSAILSRGGHRKDYRPDVPQVKVMQAVLDPLGRPLATAVVSGERADAPRALPGIARGPARVGRRGL